MYNRIIKPIFIGSLLGAVLFMMPFFIMSALFFFFTAAIIFRVFIFRRWRRSFGMYRSAHFADNIRNMSNADYQRFRQKHYRPNGPTIEVEIK